MASAWTVLKPNRVTSPAFASFGSALARIRATIWSITSIAFRRPITMWSRSSAFFSR